MKLASTSLHAVKTAEVDRLKGQFLASLNGHNPNAALRSVLSSRRCNTIADQVDVGSGIATGSVGTEAKANVESLT